MKKLLVLSLAVLFSLSAFADNCSNVLSTSTFFTSEEADQLCQTFGSEVETSLIPKTTNSINLGSASKSFANVYVGTAAIMSSGANVQLAAYVPTLAATPVAGTNQFVPGLNVIPTNAANNAGFLGPATPVPGQQFTIVNNSGAAQRIKAAGGATLNGATAGGYISIASLATVECKTASATNQICEQPVIPTPAGP